MWNMKHEKHFSWKNIHKPGGETLTHMWRFRGGAHLRNSFWHLLMNFEKPKKSEFWKNEEKKKKIAEVWRYRVRQILFVILGHFLPFTPKPLPPLKPENQNFEKMKNTSGEAIILNCATKNMIKWCVLTQMFFALLPYYEPWKLKFEKNEHVHPKSRSYDVWFLRYKV